MRGKAFSPLSILQLTYWSNFKSKNFKKHKVDGHVHFTISAVSTSMWAVVSTSFSILTHVTVLLLQIPFLCPFRFLSLNCSGTSEFQAGRTLEVGKGFFDHSGMLPGPRKKASSGHWACTHWMLLTRPLARDSMCLCNLQGRWCYSYSREETGVQRLRSLPGPSS